MKQLLLLLFSALAGFGSAAFAALPPIQVVMGQNAEPCRTRTFLQPVAIYRDPSLFLGSFGAYLADPTRGLDELLRERPLLTKVVGAVAIRKVGDERAFHSFPVIQQMYGNVDKRFLADEAPRTVPVVLCGENSAYRDTMGFVISKDLVEAERPAQGLPPSIEPNPVPSWPQSLMAPN